MFDEKIVALSYLPNKQRRSHNHKRRNKYMFCPDEQQNIVESKTQTIPTTIPQIPQMPTTQTIPTTTPITIPPIPQMPTTQTTIPTTIQDRGIKRKGMGFTISADPNVSLNPSNSDILSAVPKMRKRFV